MKTEPIDETDQTNEQSTKSLPTPPPQPSAPQSIQQTQPRSLASPHEPDQSNDVDHVDKSSEQVMLDKNKLDRLFNCLRKVGSAIQELVDEGSSPAYPTCNASSRSSKEHEVPKNYMPHSKVTKDIGCQNHGSGSLVHRSVGDRNPIIRSMEEFEALEQYEQRRYLFSQLDTYGRNYFKNLEEKDRRRRRLCHLQSEFISLMLPQFSLIHSIMAEGLRNEWQNKLQIIEELTRTLNDVDERLNFTNDGFTRDQPSSGINLSIAHQRMTKNGNHGNEEEYENDEDDIGADYDEMNRKHSYFNGNLSESSHREVSPSDELNNSAECLRLANERFQQIKRTSAEAQEDASGVPVDLTTDSEFSNQLSRTCDPAVFKRQFTRKLITPQNKNNNSGNNDPASPKPTGIHKYKICLFRDGSYRCYYIGKDRSCNMRQHWLHRHGVDAPPEHFYARKDLTEAEVQKYKLKYEVQKSSFPKTRDPLMSTIFQQSSAKRQKLSPTQQENAPQQA